MIAEANKLVKHFGKVKAVDGVSFKIREGEVFGLLGPNGAGKTTTISMLSTLVTPTRGKAKVAGFDVVQQQDEVRKSIGIVFQEPALDSDLTAYENLDFHGRLYNVQNTAARIKAVLELVELWDKRDVPVKNYSGGMKRRLEIARGLMHEPKMLFLDEPTLGLDPQTRRHVWDYIIRLAKSDRMTLLLTTHYMDEADQLCDRIAIMDKGKIIAIDTPKRLKAKLGGGATLMFDVSDAKKFCSLLPKNACGHKTLESGIVQVTSKHGETMIPRLIAMAQKKGIIVKSVTMHESTLEDVFMRLTGRQLRDEETNGKGAWHR